MEDPWSFASGDADLEGKGRPRFYLFKDYVPVHPTQSLLSEDFVIYSLSSPDAHEMVHGYILKNFLDLGDENMLFKKQHHLIC